MCYGFDIELEIWQTGDVVDVAEEVISRASADCKKQSVKRRWLWGHDGNPS